jgi:O-antigen ligase
VAIWLGFAQALAILTLVGFAAAVAGVRQPILGLLGVGLLTVLDPVMRHLLLNTGGLLRWNSYNYWLLLATVWFFPQVWRLADPHSRLLRLLVILLLIELLWAPRTENGIQNLLNLSTVFAVVIYFLRTPRDAKTMCWLGIVMGTAAAASTFAFYGVNSSVEVMNKNAFSMVPLAGVLGACLGLPYAASVKRAEPILVLLAALNATGVFLSRSRGTFLVALIGLAYLVVEIPTWTKRVTYVAVAAAAAFFVAAGFARLEQTASARVEKLFDSKLSFEERTSGRSNLVLGALQIFRDHPLGVGTGAFEDAWSTLEQPGVTNQWRVGMQVPAHSAWIMVLAENGFPGILLFTAYVLSFAAIGLSRSNQRLSRLGLFATIVLATAFLSTEFQSKAVWFVAAAATAMLHSRVAGVAHPARVLRRKRLSGFGRTATVDA